MSVHTSPHLVNSCGVSSVVNEQVIVTVELKLIETQHETLQDRLRLECDEAIQIVLVLRPQNGAIDLAIELLQKMALAKRSHVICPSNQCVRCYYLQLFS